MIYWGSMAPIRNFADFWPFYLREHARPGTRALHHLGSSLAIVCGAVGLASGRTGLLLAMPVVGYLFAWTGHFAIERNRPATFRYPLWSFAADWRMWWLWIAGRLGAELEKAGVRSSR
jgi:hypothetical protein